MKGSFKMKIFFDTEFTGLHRDTTLLSLGAVSEDGKTFYAEFTDYDKSQVNDWILHNVIKNMPLLAYHIHKPKEDRYWQWSKHKVEAVGTKAEIAEDFKDWILDIHGYTSSWVDDYDESKLPDFPICEFWSDCLAYDWVLLCDMYGGALNIPKFFYYIPFDICTLFELKNIDPDINREKFAGLDADVSIRKHNALWGAKVIKACYEKLEGNFKF